MFAAMYLSTVQPPATGQGSYVLGTSSPTSITLQWRITPSVNSGGTTYYNITVSPDSNAVISLHTPCTSGHVCRTISNLRPVEIYQISIMVFVDNWCNLDIVGTGCTSWYSDVTSGYFKTGIYFDLILLVTIKATMSSYLTSVF